MARRAALLLAALALCAGAVSAAKDCTGIAGCTDCKYVTTDRKGALLFCTTCGEAGYTLRDKKGRCECADGFYSRTADGRRTGRCNAVDAGYVASAGKIDEPSNVARECLANSQPDATRSRCLCKPGFFQVLGGQTPRCAECVGAMSYNDEPSTRMTCKICPVGKVANTDKTGCVALSESLSGVTSTLNRTISDVSAKVAPSIVATTAKINNLGADLKAGASELQSKAADLSAKAKQGPSALITMAKTRADLELPKLANSLPKLNLTNPLAGKLNLTSGLAGRLNLTGTPLAGKLDPAGALAKFAAGRAAKAAPANDVVLVKATDKAAVAKPAAEAKPAAQAKAADAKLAAEAKPVAANATLPAAAAANVTAPANATTAAAAAPVAANATAPAANATAPVAANATAPAANATEAANEAAPAGKAGRKKAARGGLGGLLGRRAAPGPGEILEITDGAEVSDEVEMQIPDESEEEYDYSDEVVLGPNGEQVSKEETAGFLDDEEEGADGKRKRGARSQGWQDFSIKMGERGIAVPTWESLTGAVPPMEDVPGLEKGASSGIMAAWKMVSAFSKSDDFAELMATVPQNLGTAMRKNKATDYED
ncbi:hypothetical protein Rsub_05028 [Raphidocelis subcapitata]|uniref:Tyrosine-protein kinase ephrin type A/B receptor-like domain-containing protein n=1 Tax=Raphidocelis subcapitata TaxID=307507 RepID=A0A2V0NZB1_9CHLO|nr:hypothetical protein Rsub_05028 [Raphidocelis subcapitata]|eukprot:GBF92659.1 hypothetical protein Rsub_05028 [Raphidocelis subcapitata]